MKIAGTGTNRIARINIKENYQFNKLIFQNICNFQSINNDTCHKKKHEE